MKAMKKSYWIGFSLLEISYWCFHVSFIGYLMSFLLSKNISNTILSIFLASYLLASFLGSLVWGTVCDRFHANRRVSIACFLAAGILMYMIYFCSGSVPMLALLYPLIGFVSLPQGAIIDSWLLQTCENDLSIYGKIRCIPSLTCAITSFTLGRLISAFDYYFMLIFGTIFLLTGILTARLLPGNQNVRSDSPAVSFSFRSVKHLFTNHSYRYLILILLLIGLAIAPMNNLKAAILEDVGGTVADYGIDAFISAIIQVPFIAFAGKIEKYPLRTRYILTALLPLMALSLAFCATSPAAVFAGSFFYNIGVGIILPLMRSVTEKSTDPAFRNLGHNIADAVYNSVAGIISLLYSGVVIDIFGMKSMLQICIVIVSIAAAITSVEAVCHLFSAKKCAPRRSLMP